MSKAASATSLEFNPQEPSGKKVNNLMAAAGNKTFIPYSV